MKKSFEELHGHYIEDLWPGMSASVSKVLTEEDVAMYARLSTDDNPFRDILRASFARVCAGSCPATADSKSDGRMG